MIFDFQINPNYTFLHAINMAQNNEPFAGWGEFTNEIWEDNPAVFYFLAGSPEYTLYLSSEQSLDLLVKQASKVLEAVKRNSTYSQLIEETSDYLKFVDQQWQQNEQNALSIIQELTGLEFLRSKIVIYLTHPKLKNGLTVDKKTIVWGHSEDFKNYTTVYLCHELLHILTDLDNSQITHAIIELLTDNELRIRLNQKGTYFEYPGHPSLRPLTKKLLPRWKSYLKKEDKNIFKFISEIKKSQLTKADL